VEPSTAVERLVASQHRRLDSMFAEVVGAVREVESANAVRAAFARTHAQVEQHLAAPPQRAALAAVATEHDDFRARIGRVAEQIDGDGLAAVEPLLATLAADLERHEAAEEDLLLRIGKELGDDLEL
jgi:hypothetical protein